MLALPVFTRYLYFNSIRSVKKPQSKCNIVPLGLCASQLPIIMLFVISYYRIVSRKSLEITGIYTLLKLECKQVITRVDLR